MFRFFYIRKMKLDTGTIWTFEQSPNKQDFFGNKVISTQPSENQQPQCFRTPELLINTFFNYMSKMHINLVHWNSLHPKKAIIPTFSGQNQIFSVKTTNPELTTYTIGKLGLLR